MKYLVLLAILAIFSSLGVALYFMLKQGSKGNRMVVALGMRVGMSILLFVCVLAAWKLGYIIPPASPPAANATFSGNKKAPLSVPLAVPWPGALTASKPEYTDPARPRPQSANTKPHLQNQSACRR